MLWVGVGVQEGDGDGCDLVGPELAGGGPNRFFVQRNQDLTVEPGPFRDFDDVPWAHRPVGFDPCLGVHQPRRPVAADLQHKLESLRHHQSHRRALVLQYGVGGDGRPVENVLDLGGFHRVCGQHLPESGQESGAGVVGSGWGLVDPLFVGSQVAEHDVGKSAAHIHRNRIVVHVSSTLIHYLSEKRRGLF